MMTKYQNSLCDIGNYWLHDFRYVEETKSGILERCSRCGVQMHFPHNVNNAYYLSYHIRSAIQPGDPLFFREYPNAIKD